VLFIAILGDGRIIFGACDTDGTDNAIMFIFHGFMKPEFHK